MNWTNEDCYLAIAMLTVGHMFGSWHSQAQVVGQHPTVFTQQRQQDIINYVSNQWFALKEVAGLQGFNNYEGQHIFTLSLHTVLINKHETVWHRGQQQDEGQMWCFTP